MQHAKLVILAVALATVYADVQASEPKVTAVPLSSLDGCTLAKRWVGLWQRKTEGVMLRCGATDFFVLTPSNLLGHVRIRNAEQALEYVRLFSSAESFNLFDLNGMVELYPGAKTATAQEPFNYIRPDVFAKWKLTTASARQIRDHPCEATLELICGREFEIKRTVVFADQRVYEVTELVRERGFYTIAAKKILLKDASRIGVLHFGDL